VQLEEYISELLFEHDCVIVPDFGGFIGNYSPSRIDPVKHLFEPPHKKILFNKGLIQNDGLLANYLSKKENISYSQALNEISKTVKKYQAEIKNNKRTSLDNIGVLYTDEQGNLLFQQDEKVNYLPEAFGLSAFYHLPVEQSQADEGKVVELHPRRSKVRTYAAAAAIGAVIASAFWISINQTNVGINYSNLNIFGKKDVRQYSFVQRVPIPAIPDIKDSVAVSLPKPPANPAEVNGDYHIVVGCFKYIENAQAMIRKMKSQNINASFVGTTNGLYMVGYGKFATRDEAEASVTSYRQNYKADAWVYAKPKI
jgi:hypothetical protein